MSYAIGCIGTSADLRSKATVAKLSLAKRKSLVPKRNQDRKLVYALVSHDGDPHLKMVKVRLGHIQNVKEAFYYSNVEYLTVKGTKVLVKPKVKVERKKAVRRPA